MSIWWVLAKKAEAVRLRFLISSKACPDVQDRGEILSSQNNGSRARDDYSDVLHGKKIRAVNMRVWSLRARKVNEVMIRS